LTVALVNWTLVLDILGAVDSCALEFTLVKLLHCGFQIGAIFEFHKAFAITITTSLGVDHVDLSLTCKVFKILPAGIRR